MAEPLAYFITFTTYGTWLHGRDPGSVNSEAALAAAIVYVVSEQGETMCYFDSRTTSTRVNDPKVNEPEA